MRIRWLSNLYSSSLYKLLTQCRQQIKIFSLLFGIGLSLSLLVSACAANSNSMNSTNSHAAPVADNTTPAQEKVLRIGYQKSGVLFLVKHRGGLEKRLKPLNVDVKWHEFPSPTPLVEALGAESLDIGQTSDAGAITAQAAGIDMVTVANSRPSPKSLAILVAKDSPLQKITDLKGKKVAFNKGSVAQALIIQALTSAGMKYSDIQPVFLQPPEGRAAFERGSIDAWVVWDPFFAAAERKANARALVDGEGLNPFREFYLASRQFADENPDIVKQVIAEAQEVGKWATKNPQEVAKFLAPHMKLDVATMKLAESRKTRYGAQLIQPEALAEQQKVADNFSQLKLIPKPIEVANAAWSPK